MWDSCFVTNVYSMTLAQKIYRSTLALLLFLTFTACHRSQEPQVSRGTLTMYHNFPSTYLEPRTIRVWTPEGYPDQAPYDVLYMHDGQMLYDSAVAWNHQEWGVDEVMQQLLDSGLIRPTIVVGIDFGSDRIAEYSPDEVADYLPAGESLYAEGTPMGNRYLDFLVHELRPFIDTTYAVATGPEHTYVLGSSCGGLISSYAICRHPEVFGGAACLSTHCTFSHIRNRDPRPQSMEAYLRFLHDRLPEANTRLIYFDCGDETLDQNYLAMFGRMDTTITALGYDSAHYRHLLFPGAAHTETDWQNRLHIPLQFLLGTSAQ